MRFLFCFVSLFSICLGFVCLRLLCLANLSEIRQKIIMLEKKGNIRRPIAVCSHKYSPINRTISIFVVRTMHKAQVIWIRLKQTKQKQNSLIICQMYGYNFVHQPAQPARTTIFKLHPRATLRQSKIVVNKNIIFS